jgi:hypothetical protein
MVVLGVILIVLGLFVPALKILFDIGVVLAVIGLVLILLNGAGHGLGGRHYW